MESIERRPALSSPLLSPPSEREIASRAARQRNTPLTALPLPYPWTALCQGRAEPLNYRTQ
jgi:hypothetical protein